MKTAVIYARYSSDNQTEQSIEGQLRVCQQFAQSNNIVVVDTYIDRAMTGTNDNRVAFQKMLKDSCKKQFDIVLVYKLDRFSRNKYESVIHKKTLKDNGVKIVSAMENIPDSPEGILMETLLEGFNQYFSEELAQKVNRGIRESWLKGNSTGGQHLFGYDVIDKKYVVNEYESNIVKEIFIKYSQGYLARTIAEELNANGFRRNDGKEFDMKYILYILHNRKYTGIVERQGVVYDNIFPAIISNELWQKVNAINEENKKSPSRKKEIYDYILSGKLVCGICKHKMVGESGTSRTKEAHYYYSCLSRRRRKLKCEQKSIQKQLLEDLVIETTMQLLNNETNLQFLTDKLFEYHQNKLLGNDKLKFLEKHRNEAFKSSKNIIKAIEQGIITEMTKSRLTELEKQILELDIAIEKEKQKTHTHLTKLQIYQYLKKYVFESCEDIKIRKHIINTFVRQIILYPDKIYICYNFSETSELCNFTQQSIIETEKQINSALKNNVSSYILAVGEPSKTKSMDLVFFSVWLTAECE